MHEKHIIFSYKIFLKLLFDDVYFFLLNNMYLSSRFTVSFLPSFVGDIVWVHDYHLMLLPKALRERNLDIKIIYFVHIPFPTSQIFRSLPDANELLESMTCADVVGFHSFDFSRHFLIACKRMLGLKYHSTPGGLLVIEVGNREVILSMSHVSIEPNLIDRACKDPETLQMAAAIKEKHRGKKIIVSVDVLQRLSGGSLRMYAYEKLLTDNHSLLMQTKGLFVCLFVYYLFIYY